MFLLLRYTGENSTAQFLRMDAMLGAGDTRSKVSNAIFSVIVSEIIIVSVIVIVSVSVIVMNIDLLFDP